MGEVVNVASRMESSAEPDQIQVTDTIQKSLCLNYTFEKRGDIEIRNMGSVTTWYLTGRVTER